MSRNYDIEPGNCDEVHKIAGKITPAVISSTSLISGLIFTEYIKFLKTKIGKYLRNSDVIMDGIFPDFSPYYCAFMKCNKPRLLGSENYKPEAFYIKYMNEWEIIVIKGKKTCENLIKYLENEYSCKIEQVFFDGELIYDSAIFDLRYLEIKPLEGKDELQKMIYLKNEGKKRKQKEKKKAELMSLYREELENSFEEKKMKGDRLLKLKVICEKGKLSQIYYEMQN